MSSGLSHGPARVCQISWRGNDRNMLARQKCCCHRTAGLGIPVEVAPILRYLGTPVSPQALSAVLCQPCQRCLMWPVPCAVGCARLEPPASHVGMVFCSGHICLPSIGQGPAQLPAGVPVCHACVTAALPCHQHAWLPAASSSQQPPHREAPDPQPLARCPTPAVSRETLDSQRQLCHENNLYHGLLGCYLSPGAFWGNLVFMGKPEEEQEVSRLHRLARHQEPSSDTRHPGVQECATPSLEAQSPPGLPQLHSCTWLGGVFPTRSGRAVDGGRAVPPAAEPTSLPLAVAAVTVVVARPHCPRVPPQLSLRLLLRRRGPRIPRLFLGWPYQPSCPCCRLPPH